MKVLRGYATVSFGQVHYRYTGTARRPVLVLLHQTPSTSAMYEDLMRALSGDFRLLAPDTPGIGLSDPVDGGMTIDALANGIAEFLDGLGIGRCCVFGHHTGAAIATQLAADHPERVEALALSGPTLIDADLRKKLPEVSATLPADSGGGHLVGRWRRILRMDRDVPLRIAQRETLNAISMGDRYSAAYEAVMAHDVERALAALICPVLVFAGTRDVLYPQLDAAHALLANGSRREIADAGSLVCETHCHEVAALLRDFFPAEAA